MDDSVEAKLDVLDAMNTALGKITNVQIRLTLKGNTDLANELNTHREALLAQIATLQGKVADQWSVDASTLSSQLGAANGYIQARIRNIQKNVNVANSAVQIIGKIDGALTFLKTVVP